MHNVPKRAKSGLLYIAIFYRYLISSPDLAGPRQSLRWMCWRELIAVEQMPVFAGSDSAAVLSCSHFLDIERAAVFTSAPGSHQLVLGRTQGDGAVSPAGFKLD